MTKCPNEAKYAYVWPGQELAYTCEDHARQLKAVATAMGFHLAFINLTLGDIAPRCQQNIKEENTVRGC